MFVVEFCFIVTSFVIGIFSSFLEKICLCLVCETAGPTTILVLDLMTFNCFLQLFQLKVIEEFDKFVPTEVNNR